MSALQAGAGELTHRESEGLSSKATPRELQGPAGELTDRELDAIAGGGIVIFARPPIVLGRGKGL
jgi:hypothetical protein